MNKVAYGLMAMGVLLMAFGIYFILEALASKSWQPVDATINNIKIPGRLSSTSSATQRRIEYSVVITYNYTIEGEKYENANYSLGTGDTAKGGFNNRTDARTWLKTTPYSKGNAITIYVNPQSPTQTVISTGINIGTIVPSIIGALFLLLGYFLRRIFQKQNLEKLNTNNPENVNTS